LTELPVVLKGILHSVDASLTAYWRVSKRYVPLSKRSEDAPRSTWMAASGVEWTYLRLWLSARGPSSSVAPSCGGSRLTALPAFGAC
jgi:hypothetical protein